MLNTEFLHQEQQGIKRALAAMVVRIIRPFAKILLRHGMSCQEFTEISRWIFVDVAMNDDEFALKGRSKQFKSRAAVLTGLSRKEVLRLTSMSSPEEMENEIRSYNRAARVLDGWTENPLFCDGKDKPKDLTFKSGTGSFADLVRLYSGDVPPRAVLDELKRCGSVEVLDDGKIRLKKMSFFPQVGSADELKLIKESTGYLLDTLDNNFSPNPERKHPQRYVLSRAIPQEALPAVRDFIRTETDVLARKVNHFVCEMEDSPKKTGVRYTQAGLGLYYFEDDAQ
ncbi:MAG: DUF6502 family protein [Gammaproteobacteria bacterium]|nr:DUF6502 family protein [Gammaproteobacteria bacterium]